MKGHWEGSADLAGSGAHREDGPAQWTDCPGHSTGQGGLGPSLWDGWAGDTQDTSHTISEGEAGSLGGHAALSGGGGHSHQPGVASFCHAALDKPPLRFMP